LPSAANDLFSSEQPDFPHVLSRGELEIRERAEVPGNLDGDGRH
jgi:hypothetical protein